MEGVPSQLGSAQDLEERKVTHVELARNDGNGRREDRLVEGDCECACREGREGERRAR